MAVVVVGIDPGLAATGYGVVAARAGKLECLTYGVIRTRAADAVGVRLLHLFNEVEALLERYRPAAAGVESLYFTRNTSSALPVAQARGVVLMAFERHGVPTHEYTPQIIKQAVVGSGAADKAQVQRMVQIILGMPAAPKPDHAADALAAAITHAHTGAVTGVFHVQ